MSTSSQQAGVMARKGVGMILSATKSSVSAISKGISKARKDYSSKHEADVLADIERAGLSPVDLVFQALRRIYFLYMAGYKHELVVAATEAGKRLTSAEKTSISVDAALVFGNAVCEEAQKYGSFDKGSYFQGLLNKSRVSKEHFDRTSLAHDIYYAVLAASQAHGVEWHNLERVFREATARVIGNAIHATDDTKDARLKAAKALFIFASEVRVLVQEAVNKRQKTIRDAESVLRKEQERLQKQVSS